MNDWWTSKFKMERSDFSMKEKKCEKSFSIFEGFLRLMFLSGFMFDRRYCTSKGKCISKPKSQHEPVKSEKENVWVFE